LRPPIPQNDALKPAMLSGQLIRSILFLGGIEEIVRGSIYHFNISLACQIPTGSGKNIFGHDEVHDRPDLGKRKSCLWLGKGNGKHLTTYGRECHS